MKRRLYYIADNLNVIDEVTSLLQRQGVTGWSFHVVSKDEVGLYRHHLQSATPLLTRDVWRFGERGALIGLLLGFACSLIVIGALGYFQNRFLIAGIVMISLITVHGAWTGGLAGLATENYKIKRFHEDIERGNFLLMIDVKEKIRPRIEEALSYLRLDARGEDSVTVLPFSFGSN